LLALAFYRRIHKLHAAQDKWACSLEWAQIRLPGCDLNIFSWVSWNTVHDGAPDGQLDWTRLLDDEWLSGGIIDNMMADLQRSIGRIPALDARVTVAPLAFQQAIVSYSIYQPSLYTLRLLKKYKDLAEAGK
jgi:hypothetical protein